MRDHVVRIACILAASFLCCAGAISGQELRGGIEGTVTDETGNALAGVRVSAESESLLQPRVTATDGGGRFRLAALPSGNYTLSFEHPGFRPLRREGIRVGLNFIATVEIELSISGVSEFVTVRGETPAVDVRGTGVGTRFTAGALDGLPTARDIWAVLAIAPGFQMAGYDVGGSHSGTQTGYITYGFEGQNKTLLEGINVTENQDLNAGYFDFGSFEEVELGGSGNLGEQSGPGALLNVSVKSGGNRLQGQVYFDYQNEELTSDNLPAELAASGGRTDDGFRAPPGGLVRGNPVTRQYDLDAGVGGPLVKDRAWFYAGYRKQQQLQGILGLAEKAETGLENFTFKGTVQLGAQNQVIAFFNQRSKFQPYRNVSLSTPREAAHFQDSVNRPWKIEWTRIVSERAFLDVQLASWMNSFPLYPTGTRSTSTEGVGPGRIDLATGQRSGANEFYWNRDLEKPQVSASFLYDLPDAAGRHSFKLGTELYRERRIVERFQPGHVFYRDRNGAPAEVDLYNTPNTGINDAHHFSIYARDSWTMSSRLTVHAGLRYERYALGWPEQSIVPELSTFFPPSSTPATTVKVYHSASPRLGLAFDPTGDGRSVAKVFWGRFYFNPSIFHSDKENPAGNLRLRYRFEDRNGNRILDGPEELGPFLRSLDGAGFFRVDRDIEHAYGDELSAHWERELGGELALRGSYIYKNMRNGWGLVDVGRAEAYTIPVTLTDPATGRTFELLDREPGAAEEVVFTNPGRVGLPDYSADYHTIGAAVRRHFRGRWMVMSSFEHTWAADFRENGQFSTSSLLLARHRVCGVGEFECGNVFSPNARRFGRMSSRWWNVKLVGRYVFGKGFGVSGSYKLQSGFNYAPLASVSLPNAGIETIFVDPIENRRSPAVAIADVRLEKSFPLGDGGSRVTAVADVFNLLNASPVTNFRLTAGPRFQEVLALLDPRVVRLGLRWEF